jgi:hypothetical protein
VDSTLRLLKENNMEQIAAFYKVDQDGVFLQAPNFVFGAYDAYQLLKTNRTEYTYPVDGWYWFDTLDEAREFFNLQEL